jgi:SAM-dependent methyltransferase
MALPTPSFLASGSGRVLDMGAGSGRSAIMALEARPKCTLVALDLFGEQYDKHFGTDGKTQDVTQIGRERLLANFRAAGVEQRASIQPGDMRHMPLEAASFDAIVNAYAIDHLNTEGIRQSLAEGARVLKPRRLAELCVGSGAAAWRHARAGQVDTASERSWIRCC